MEQGGEGTPTIKFRLEGVAALEDVQGKMLASIIIFILGLIHSLYIMGDIVLRIWY